MGFALVNRHPTSLRETILKDFILRRSIRKVLGTLVMPFRIEGFAYGFNFILRKGWKAFCKWCILAWRHWVPPGSLVRESKSPNNFHWSPKVSSIAAFTSRNFALFSLYKYPFLACWYVFLSCSVWDLIYLASICLFCHFCTKASALNQVSLFWSLFKDSFSGTILSNAIVQALFATSRQVLGNLSSGKV